MMANGVRILLVLFAFTLLVGLGLGALGSRATDLDAAISGVIAVVKTALLTGSRLRWLQAAAGGVFAALALSFIDRLVNGDAYADELAGGAQALRQARDGSQLLAAVLLLSSAGQLAWVAGKTVNAKESATRAKRMVDAVEPVARRMVGADPKPPERPEPAAEGEPIRVMLSVNHRGPRSKVLINDAFVGYTTYMADISCLRGETLVLSIVPPKGRKIVRTKLCEGPTLVLSE